MIRVLHIVGSLERAGIESFIMNLYRSIDRDEVQFDFLIYNTPSESSYAEEVRRMGGKIYTVTPKTKGWIKNYKGIKRVVKDNGYKIVWRSCSNCVGGTDIIPAAMGGANIRILHAHSSNSFGLSGRLHVIFRPVVNLFATKRFSCGIRAGKWMFGRRKYEIIPNGIHSERFRYDEKKRDEVRKKFGIEDKILIGNVARFEKVKNQTFLLDVFSQYDSKFNDGVLLLVGGGENESVCREKARELGIEDKVIFAGERKDIPDLMQAMDVFVLPSLYEGFPVTLVEAQTVGLSCVVSDSVSDETNIYGGVRFISLSSSIDAWSELIRESSKKRYRDGNKNMISAGYDIKRIATKITEYLLEVQ